MLVVAALCAITYATLESRWRYAVVVPDLLAGRASAQWLESAPRAGGRISFALEDGAAVARLRADGQAGVPVLHWRLPVAPGLHALGAAVELKAETLRPGPQGWQAGRAQISSFDAEGRFVRYWPNEIAVVTGDTGWSTFSAVIPTGAELEAMVLVIYNAARSGVMAVRKVQVAGLEERTAFTIARQGLVLAWLLTGLWLARRLLGLGPITRAKVLVMALVLIALAGSLAPQPAFEVVVRPIQIRVSAWLAPISHLPVPGVEAPAVPRPQADEAAPSRGAGEVDGAAPGPATIGDLSTLGFKELAHFALFALLAGAALVAYPRVSPALCVLHVGLLALATETLQFFVVSRSPRLIDLAADGGGILAAAAALLLGRALMAGLRARSARRGSSGAWP